MQRRDLFCPCLIPRSPVEAAMRVGVRHAFINPQEEDSSMSKRFWVVAIMALSLLASVFAFSAAQADPSNSGKVLFATIGINAPGADTLANRNKEYVWLKNVSGASVNVANWKFTDAAGGANLVRFDEEMVADCNCGLTWVDDSDPGTPGDQNKLVLAPGRSIVIYSGAGSDTDADGVHKYYRDYKHYLNNTSGETVRLLDADNSTVDAWSYSAYGINPLRY